MKTIVQSVGAGLVVGASIAGFCAGVGFGYRAMEAVRRKLDGVLADVNRRP